MSSPHGLHDKADVAARRWRWRAPSRAPTSAGTWRDVRVVFCFVFGVTRWRRAARPWASIYSGAARHSCSCLGHSFSGACGCGLAGMIDPRLAPNWGWITLTRPRGDWVARALAVQIAKRRGGRLGVNMPATPRPSSPSRPATWPGTVELLQLQKRVRGSLGRRARQRSCFVPCCAS